MLAIDKDATGFLYSQVLELIDQKIAAGELRPGDRLPSLRRLSAGLGVSVPTVKQAYLEHNLSRDTLLGVGIAVAGPVNPQDGRVQRAGAVPTWTGIDVKSVFEAALRRRQLGRCHCCHRLSHPRPLDRLPGTTRQAS